MFQVVDDALAHCEKIFLHSSCYTKFYIILYLIFITSMTYFVISLYVFFNRPKINWALKKRLRMLRNAARISRAHRINFKYCDKDKEFVQTKLYALIRHNNSLKVPPVVTLEYNNRQESNLVKKLGQCVKPQEVYKRTTIIVFSSNYLTTHYSQVDIKKIHSEMLKMENTIHLFVDVDSENSIYTFLKGQRDIMKSIVWNEENFFDKFLFLITEGRYMANFKGREVMKNFSLKPLKITETVDGLDTPTHSQV